MSSLISLQPHNNNFDSYLQEINAGIIQIPEFQRDFIWDLDNVLNLLRSIKKNYPIGSFLFWKPEERFKVAKQLGPYFIKDDFIETFEKIKCKYVLDGYQRISSLFGALSNPKHIHNFDMDHPLFSSTFNIYYNLQEEEFEVYKLNSTINDSYIVPVYTLLDFEEFLSVSQKIQNQYSSEECNIYTSRLKRIVTTFDRYQMPVIEIAGGSLDEAIDIFTLLNKEGKPITPDWILSAKTYSSNFRLGDKIDEVLDVIEFYNFVDKKQKETAVRELVFRSIQSSFGNLYLDTRKTDIISLSKKENFKVQVEKTLSSIVEAVKFFYEDLLVVDNKLLPASMQFIFMVEFFNFNDKLTLEKKQMLKDWYWFTTYTNYFTIYSPSKRKEAFAKFQNFAKRNTDEIIYNDKSGKLFSVPELSKKVNLGAVRSKASILFMLNYSNYFEKVDVNSVDNYRILKLFSNVDNNLVNKYGECSNMIVCLNTHNNDIFFQGGKKHKDFSFLLEEQFSGEYENLFINDEMRHYYKKNDIGTVLLLRKRLIEDEEKKFLERLNSRLGIILDI